MRLSVLQLPPSLLAAARPAGQGSVASDQAVTRIVIVVGVLIGAIILVSVGVIVVRRRLLGDEDASAEPLSLHHIRLAHERGDMTDEEFARARQAIIGAAASPGQRPRPGDAGGRPPPPGHV